jgi:CBS domain-containing protein
MREPVVADVMTRQVVTAVRDTPFKELVGTMIARDIDALPVVDRAGRPVGVVDEADVLAKLEFHCGADYPPLFAGQRRRARWHKSSGLVAADVMTAPANTITEHTRLGAATHALATQDIRRLCVVDQAGRLVGLLSRQDVLRVFLRCDSIIAADVERELAAAVRGPHRITVRVADGVVTLTGRLALRSAAENAGRIAHCVPGVIAVNSDLAYETDDLMIIGL